MEFDIYNCPLEDTLNITVDRLYFLNKMKMLNQKFDVDFLQSLFYSITQGKTETNMSHIFEIFNVLKDDTYKDLFYKKEDFEVFRKILESNENIFKRQNQRKKFNSFLPCA